MSTATHPRVEKEILFTPEDLDRLPDAVSYELVGGKLVERHMGMESSFVAMQIGRKIGRFLDDHPLGLLFAPDAGYRCFPGDSDKIRKPDLSFIRSGRLPDDKPPRGYCPIPPDLAVEVISPNDLAYEVEMNVAEYKKAGVPLIWVVHPDARAVRVHRPRRATAGAVSDLGEEDAISGEDVLPGFSCPVKDLFP